MVIEPVCAQHLQTQPQPHVLVRDPAVSLLPLQVTQQPGIGGEGKRAKPAAVSQPSRTLRPCPAPRRPRQARITACMYACTNSTAVLPLPPGVSLERPVHPSNKRQLYEQSTTSTTTSSRSSKSSSMHLRRPCHACLTVQTCHNHPPARSQHADGAIGMIVSSGAQRSSASVLAENGIPLPAQKKGPASKAREATTSSREPLSGLSERHAGV